MAGLDDKQFTITRTFDAPREDVWQAWTRPRAFHRWLNPPTVFTPQESIKSDLRTGGGYAYTVVVPNRGTFPTAGSFLEVRAPERLQFTWGNPEDAEKNYPIVTIDFADVDGKTELTFHLEGARGERGSERSVADSWSDALGRLAGYLAGDAES